MTPSAKITPHGVGRGGVYRSTVLFCVTCFDAGWEEGLGPSLQAITGFRVVIVKEEEGQWDL